MRARTTATMIQNKPPIDPVRSSLQPLHKLLIATIASVELVQLSFTGFGTYQSIIMASVAFVTTMMVLWVRKNLPFSLSCYVSNTLLIVAIGQLYSTESGLAYLFPLMATHLFLTATKRRMLLFTVLGGSVLFILYVIQPVKVIGQNNGRIDTPNYVGLLISLKPLPLFCCA